VLRGAFGKFLHPKHAKSLAERRAEYIAKLERTAGVEEAKLKELEERLEFKRREASVLARVRAARQRRRKLWELLGEYGVGRPRLLRWVLIGVGVLILFLLFKAC